MSSVEATCSRCRVTFDREIPDELVEPWRGKFLRRPPVCKTCDDLQAAEYEAKEEAHRQEELDERIAARRRASGIPRQLRDIALEDALKGHRAELVAAATSWAAGETPGLLLSGPVGVGKTHLAAALARERTRRASLRWFSVPTLFALLALSFENSRRDEALSVLADSRTLVLDDLDKVRATEYAAEQIFCAIDNRLTAGAGLLVTTNLALSDIAARYPEPYGEAIASRLAGYCETFALEGSDRRMERFAA